jgi:hypothetical protein
MSYRQSTFLFDYVGYKAAVAPIVDELDKNNLEPLKNIVENVRKDHVDHQKWILHNVGTRLDNFALDQDVKYQNSLIGHWLLIMLSTFLLPAQSLEYGWSKFSLILHKLNWSKEDINLILKGNSTSLLIKKTIPPLTRVLEWNDPYWYWVMPRYGPYHGWLPLDEIVRLFERLDADKYKIGEIDDPSSNLYFPASMSLDNVYIKGIQMLKQAKEANKGLFIVVYEEDDDD